VGYLAASVVGMHRIDPELPDAAGERYNETGMASIDR
jgi:hypothetical protein